MSNMSPIAWVLSDAAPNSAFQTIYDIVSNLVGKAMPGIPKDKGYSPNYEEMVRFSIRFTNQD